ncbi:transmembrane protein [Gossypium australe]|uniref:Transmembrane protein n=1 Tax=Gossypium australe TaxID=47621 RepID=A0A5B6WKB6_9ROSI|nr:transmembrane protein [Gossypium australe]
MTEISRSRSLRFLLFFASVSLHFISGFSDESKGSNNSSKTKSNAINNTGTKVIFIVLGLVAVGLFSFFLFKLWQKKKRDEQYARLLKLFEEDDELEVELGLRD